MRQLIAALTLIAATTSAAFAQDEADVDGVRAAVMAYFNAGNTGDPDLAREAFYTSTGDMFIYRNDEDGERVDTMNLGDFAARFGRAMPDRTVTFHDITMAEGRVASAHITIDWADGRFVDDMFLLYKIDGQWKIVAKAFAWH
ncbi:MAG: nuclear transport factor 2 family protein [Maricaulis sp.]|jgi:hypothetical protein|uniref:nuclear transport factor 2 family protein n=1 Tax=Maricaulis sp. TaxID=1486257 RepID=UPI001AFE67EC|nr:nuclear transport factor 2 family protein [Maricaulis sp.]MBO6729573.1 nuclear transport factor 2 family protein [Maricaulis sp.]MBO6846664.1 nuclear transport factor 2 family protein [Maricaulis sp.]MBO6877752.1 nuclear transport factor 2 family protein [Maricaulis sp.]MDM7984696.1 nuclear transport factor 2 family protein [Maricaulis sp.]